MTTPQLDLTYLAELVTRFAGAPTTASTLAGDPSFEDLGIDSLGLLGIVTEVENALNISLPEGAQIVEHPSELVDLVSTRTNRRA